MLVELRYMLNTFVSIIERNTILWILKVLSIQPTNLSVTVVIILPCDK